MVPPVMRCHYEVLEVERDAGPDILKKQYRKLALKFHPDKNPDDPEGAKQTFQLIQQAYEVLADPQERAWYDNHREQILRGARGEKLDEEGLDVFQYFTSACYSGFGDDDGGFFGVYREVFNTLAAEDLEFVTEETEAEIPGFGGPCDEYETVVGPFYAYWAGYSTSRSYTWLDKYDTRQGENRWVKRKMEAENKKVRDKARKERNEAVRNLVGFVRKRDKRVAEQSRKLAERAAQNKQKTAEFQARQRQERRELFSAAHGDQAGFGMGELEDQLRQLEGQYSDSEEEDFNDDSGEEGSGDQDEDGGEEESLGEEVDSLYCVACDRQFRSEAARENHETSRKHKENLQRLVAEMQEEEEEAAAVKLKSDILEVNSGGDVNELTDITSDEEIKSAVIELPTSSKGRSKKQKKKQKKRVVLATGSDIDSDDAPAAGETVVSNGVSEEATEIDVTVSKKARRKNKKKLKSEAAVVDSDPVELILEPEEAVIADINEEKDVKESRGKKSKKSKLKAAEPEVELSSGDLTCAQCKSQFLSKNKLFSHLKTTGHSVYLPKSDTTATNSSNSKSKRKK